MRRILLVGLLLAYGALLGGITITWQTLSAHSASRLDTIDSLVERGAFAIDGAPFETIDKVRIDGRYYSHQPPLPAVLGALAYLPLRHLGMRLGKDHGLTLTLITFALNGLATMLGLVCFHLALGKTRCLPALRLPVTASLAFATLLLPYSTTVNSHGFVAGWIIAGFYWYLLSCEQKGGIGVTFLAGLAFAVCASADHTMLAFYALFAVCVPRSRVLWFFLPAAVTLLPTMYYYYAVGHSFTPFAARQDLFVYAGSVWSASAQGGTMNLTGGSWNTPAFAAAYGVLLLLGSNGFLIYNPMASLALYGLTCAIPQREAVVILVGSVAIVGYYALASTNFSGDAYSIRWFVPLLPLWWLFVPAALGGFTRPAKWTFWVLFAAGVFYAGAGALDPWPPSGDGYATPLVNIAVRIKGLH